MGFRVEPFQDKYQAEVVQLAKQILEGEFKMVLDDDYYKEIGDIPNSFQKDGNYWVALFNNRVIGTMAITDIGNKNMVLREVFLLEEYRGKERGYALELLKTAFKWARDHHAETVFLGSAAEFIAAHKFYVRHGFKEIEKKGLPEGFHIMDVDKKFYRYDLKV